jgi:hypothetical protein
MGQLIARWAARLGSGPKARARRRERKGRWPGGFAVEKRWAEEARRTARPKRKEESGERDLGFSLFFLNSFQIFFQTLQTSLKQ